MEEPLSPHACPPIRTNPERDANTEQVREARMQARRKIMNREAKQLYWYSKYIAYRYVGTN
jgi:hypothetical protein